MTPRPSQFRPLMHTVKVIKGLHLKVLNKMSFKVFVLAALVTRFLDRTEQLSKFTPLHARYTLAEYRE